MKKISLDPYRTKGVKIFSGEGRGRAVAKDIKEHYGEDVIIEIPDDVYLVSSSFRRGFNEILKGKLEEWKL